ncbi:hypothetical protein ABZ234_18180 [Nocardiopsis sp. NPDC006198]|uniref:hypothetical protein n=1 Tax=Nocardiopsis sp. NPDC006198 TaxID=3154472 RepID=UPI0033BA9276
MDATPHPRHDPAVVAHAAHVLDLLGGPLTPVEVPAPGPALPSRTPGPVRRRPGAPLEPLHPFPQPGGPPPPQDGERRRPPLPTGPPRSRGLFSRLASLVRRPPGPAGAPPGGPGERTGERRDLTRSLARYRAAPTEDHHLVLLESISKSLDAYVELQEQRARAEREQAEQAHRSAVAAHRVAVAGMVFGAAGWLVALAQLLLSLLGGG